MFFAMCCNITFVSHPWDETMAMHAGFHAGLHGEPLSLTNITDQRTALDWYGHGLRERLASQ